MGDGSVSLGARVAASELKNAMKAARRAGVVTEPERLISKGDVLPLARLHNEIAIAVDMTLHLMCLHGKSERENKSSPHLVDVLLRRFRNGGIVIDVGVIGTADGVTTRERNMEDGALRVGISG
jgi:uncharacterized protein related to proFAR isomerase